ncbi:MAG: hypothetical protein M1832_004000 [Thelocarpon impressellum]|nr:MAG: hypothetical protein M1832_004000 [Thelocarpon impressellum]
MPSDIRNFFGGGRGSQPAVSSQPEVPAKKQKTKKRKVVEDSDDENSIEGPKKTPEKKARLKKESPEAQETSTADYFQSKKPTRSTPTKRQGKAEISAATQSTPSKRTPRSSKAKETPTSQPSNGRTSARKKKTTSYAEPKDDEDAFIEDEDADDIYMEEFKNGRKGAKDDYVDVSDVEEAPRKKPSSRGKRASKPKEPDEFDLEDIDMEDDFAPPPLQEKVVAKRQTNGHKSSTPSKQKARQSVDIRGGEDDEPEKKAVKRASPAKKQTPKKAKSPAKQELVQGSTDVDNILGSIPTVRPPSPPPKTGEPSKFSYQNHAARAAPPPGAGTKEIPIGAENCLAGQTFVFTGLLETLGREEGQELVKRYGGHVTTAPSSKTSFVVLGEDAGPKKLEKIRSLNIKTIDEDGLFELIRRLPANGGDSKAAIKNEEKKQKEAQKIQQMAAEMEREERTAVAAGGAGGGTATKAAAGPKGANIDNRLWTVKYAPTTMSQICGNKGQVEKLQRWLREWPKSQKIGFKKAGKDGSFNFRAVIIHGPPGIGKTTAAHIVAKAEGYDTLESNASDTRSKKLVETGLKGILDNTSLLGYFAGDEKKVDINKKKLVLIMDEVDGMSAGDRGGVGALAQVCRKTNIPMILICNERRLPKMKPFDHVTYELQFRRPTSNDVRSRIASICFREGLKLPPQVIDALIEGSHADIRQIINMISQTKLDQEAMSFDEGKAMSKAWEKHVILKPWDIANKLLGPGMFGPTSNKTLNDKTELYFNDHEFSYLMIQENYLKTKPSLANGYSGKEQRLKALELADKAAESISDGDLVDRMIHGSQQQWSLMPTHAVFSTVRPASFMYGPLGGPPAFTSWLGNNSKQGKLTRFVKEIQGHMRLRASGDRHEIRQQYLPTLWVQLVKKLQLEGKEAVSDVIELMDSYFLTKDDFDAITELGVGPMDMEGVRIETQAKATFTRLYNQQSHPLPFMKASNVVAPKKAGKEKPDLEEAIDESDEGEDVTAARDEDDEEDADLSKDKYVKQAKRKAAPAKKRKKTTAKKEAEDEEVIDDEEPDEEEVKPKGRSAKGKGKAKR